MPLLDNQLLKETSRQAAMVVKQSFVRCDLRQYARAEKLSRRDITKVARYEVSGIEREEAVRPDRDDRNDFLLPNRATIHRSSLAGRVVLKRTPPQHFLLGYFHS